MTTPDKRLFEQPAPERGDLPAPHRWVDALLLLAAGVIALDALAWGAAGCGLGVVARVAGRGASHGETSVPTAAGGVACK